MAGEAAKLDLKKLFSNWHDQASDYPESERNTGQDSFAELGMAKAMKARSKIGVFLAGIPEKTVADPN